MMSSCSCKLTAFVLTLVIGLFGGSLAELRRVGHRPEKNDGSSLSFLAVGDWGRRGRFNQSQVAHQMGRIGEELGIDFVISVGDNFYDNGLTDVGDLAFLESFSNIYTAKSLQKPWYSVLGNHDYRGNAIAQLSHVLQKIDARWCCMRSFMVDADIAQIFLLDTTPFVRKYWKHPKKNHYDWRGVAPRQQYILKLLQDLDVALSESTARWKIVIGHHPIRSVSEHGDTIELVRLLLPMLKEYGVDMYINGHDHCLEHISSNDSQIQFVTSGGGSKAWRGISNSSSPDTLRFFYDGQGFISLQLTQAEAKIEFYDINGIVLHHWNMTKELHPSI